MRKQSRFRRIRRAFESPRLRKVRKAKEFRMTVWRTIFSGIGGFCAAASLIVSVLIFVKVYLHRG